jgi:hypothetical protein
MEDNESPPPDKTLNRLASELPLEERHSLLDKLKGHSESSSDSLYVAGEEEKREDFTVLYTRLPWYYRVYYIVLSLFKGLPPVKLFEGSQISRMGHEIGTGPADLYDYEQNNLCAEFYQLLTELKEGARFFYSALDSSVNRDKGNFYAFLGSLEMGEIHRLLQVEADPQIIAEKMPDASEAEIKQQSFKIMEEAFSKINEEQRSAMYNNARSLYCLKELSSFLFDRMLAAFSYASGGGGQSCPANAVKEQLKTLCSILCSMKGPPPLPLLESLFIFQLSDRNGEKDFDMGREMRNLLNKAENALDAIRNFNKQVPLTQILRCAYRDMNISPQQISGGEDWFMVYREHWKKHLEARFTEYMRQRKRSGVIDSFRYFLKGTELKTLESAASDSNPDGPPIQEAFTLSFLLTFYSVVFMSDINRILRHILIDGEFVKRETRVKYTECYNDLIKMEDDIKRFEIKIAPTGEFGKRYAVAKQEMSSLAVKRRKIQIVLEDTSREANGIVQCTRQAIKMMIEILNIILRNEPDGKYDILGNFAKLAGKTSVFADSLTDAIQKLQKTSQILDDINAIGGHC